MKIKEGTVEHAILHDSWFVDANGSVVLALGETEDYAKTPTFKFVRNKVVINVPKNLTPEEWLDIEFPLIGRSAMNLESHAKILAGCNLINGLVLKEGVNKFFSQAGTGAKVILNLPSFLEHGNQLAFFHEDADPKKDETLYLRPNVSRIDVGYGNTPEYKVAWRVFQVGLDNSNTEFYAEANWDDKKGIKNLVEMVANREEESAMVTRALLDPTVTEEYVAKKDFWKTYVSLWEEAKPRAKRVRSGNILEAARKAYSLSDPNNGGRQPFGLTGLIGLGNVRTLCSVPLASGKILNEGVIPTRNFAAHLHMRVALNPDDSFLAQFAKILETQNEGVILREVFNFEDSSETPVPISPRVIFVASDGRLFSQAMQYQTIPSYYKIVEKHSTKFQQMNPETGKWEFVH